MPEVIEAKIKRVQELGLKEEVEYVSADLSKYNLKDVLLANKKFDASLPTFFSVEGLIYYLEQESVDNLY